MASPATSDPDQEPTSSAPEQKIIANPDFSGAPESIADWTGRPDFPRCALGAYVNIKGFEGVVVEIIGQSLRIQSAEGVKQRFNGDRLKTLFAPRDRTKPKPPPTLATRKTPAADEAPAREHIEEPDFTAPIRAIRVYASQRDFPKCAYGKHVDIPGYTGVVVEIVKDSLRVQAATGGIRRFNCGVLKKLYGSK
jgi:hypothetical protein